MSAMTAATTTMMKTMMSFVMPILSFWYYYETTFDILSLLPKQKVHGNRGHDLWQTPDGILLSNIPLYNIPVITNQDMG